jgi:hypothetical protein
VAAWCAMASGCAAPLFVTSAGMSALQAGTSAYVGGELESAEVVELHTLYQIIHEVLAEELAFDIATARAGENHAFIHTREAQGRMIRISLERKSPIVTKINIRVGLLGDQPMSRLVLGAIQSRLPAPPHRHPALDELLRTLENSTSR